MLFDGVSAPRDTWRMSAKSVFVSILDWLRAGYPEGVPGPDRVPLLALLRQTPLTEGELKEVIRNITEVKAPASDDDPIDKGEIESFISEVTNYDAGPENVRRVAAKLAAAGWPLSGTGTADPSGTGTAGAETKTGGAPGEAPPA
jgi:hypothetical protein